MSIAKSINKNSKPQPAHDRAHDVLRSERHPLDAIFAPHSVAVIGATERAGSVGRAVLWSLLSSPFGGTVYPVNEKRTSVLGIKAYGRIENIPELVDLAWWSRPRSRCRTLSGMRGSGSARGIVISAGFKEHGEKGKELEREIVERMRGSGMRLIGPNCLGVMNPISGLNATFARTLRGRGMWRSSARVAHCVRRSSTGAQRNRWVQRIRFDRFDAGRRLGRPDRLPRK